MCWTKKCIECAGGLTSQDWRAQLRDIKRKLHASKAAWKIVIGHHPPRSNGRHGNTVELLENLEPILQVTWYLQPAVLCLGSGCGRCVTWTHHIYAHMPAHALQHNLRGLHTCV